jgi:hypothetical protein
MAVSAQSVKALTGPADQDRHERQLTITHGLGMTSDLYLHSAAEAGALV